MGSVRACSCCAIVKLGVIQQTALYQFTYYRTTMSWQDYIDTQLVGRELKDAVIAGHDGNVWAKSQNFNVTPGEIQAILKNYDNQESLASSGFHLGGTKYFYLSGDDEVIRGKQGKGGVHCVKTNQTLLVGVYDAPMEPGTAADHGETWRLLERSRILVMC